MNKKKHNTIFGIKIHVFWAVLLLAFFLFQPALRADVSLTDRDAIQKKIEKAKQSRVQVKDRFDKKGNDLSKVRATGAQALIDFSGLEWYINTDITFSTSSSASGAASEASYTNAVTATTQFGGTTVTTLSDAYDGYNSIALSFDGSVGPVGTGDPSYYIYNNNGAGTTECSGRQVVLNPQVMNNIQVVRKIYVPANDSFCRWLNIFTNQDSQVRTFNMITCNNFGSDSNTIITGTADGDTIAEVTDNWVTTMQNYTSGTSPDPRLGHVLQGPGAPVGVGNIYFANGDDNPYWSYTITLQPGATAIIMNFGVGQPSKAAAAAKCAELEALPANATACMSAAEISQVVNFRTAAVSYVVAFFANDGGYIEGDTLQRVDPGANCTPVEAIPDLGYHFSGWTGHYVGTANPLVVRNVQRNMRIYANFANAAPTVKIVSPIAGSTVSGVVTIKATASDDLAVKKVELYVDNVLKKTDAIAPYEYSWDTLAALSGTHTIKAIAYDAADAAGSDEISVNVQNITLTLSGSRLEEQAWIIRRYYGQLQLQVANPGGASIAKYLVYRKTGTGDFQVIGEILASAVTGGIASYQDRYLEKSLVYTYKISAVDGSGIVLQTSNEITL